MRPPHRSRRIPNARNRPAGGDGRWVMGGRGRATARPTPVVRSATPRGTSAGRLYPRIASLGARRRRRVVGRLRDFAPSSRKSRHRTSPVRADFGRILPAARHTKLMQSFRFLHQPQSHVVGWSDRSEPIDPRAKANDQRSSLHRRCHMRATKIFHVVARIQRARTLRPIGGRAGMILCHLGIAAPHNTFSGRSIAARSDSSVICISGLSSPSRMS